MTTTLKQSTIFESTMLLNDMPHVIIESIDEYLCKGCDLDQNGDIDLKDYELYLEQQINARIV